MAIKLAKFKIFVAFFLGPASFLLPSGYKSSSIHYFYGFQALKRNQLHKPQLMEPKQLAKFRLQLVFAREEHVIYVLRDAQSPLEEMPVVRNAAEHHVAFGDLGTSQFKTP